MSKKLILGDINNGIIKDGFHYYPIPVTGDALMLDAIKDGLLENMAKLINVDSKFIIENFMVVGSWNRKPKGEEHKDLDLVCQLPEAAISKLLSALPTKVFFYKGLSTFTFTVPDFFGIPRKIDIFKVESMNFSFKAYQVPRFYRTDWPSWSRNMILNAIAKVIVKDPSKCGTGRFLPYRGLCLYYENGNEILTTNWDRMLEILGFDSVDRTEDIIEGIQKSWCDRDKDAMMTILYKDKKLVNLLENNNKKVRDIHDEIYKKYQRV